MRVERERGNVSTQAWAEDSCTVSTKGVRGPEGACAGDAFLTSCLS